MRRFFVEIGLVVVIGAVLVSVVVFWERAGSSPRRTTDSGEIAWTCYDETLRSTTPIAVHGDGELCFAESAVRATIDAGDLVPGELYTAWLAYVETPGVCSATPCPLPEVVRLDPPVPFLRFDTTVSDGTRRATLSSTFRGLTLAPSAQVQLLVVGHGRAHTGEGRPYQLLGATWPGVMRDGPTGAGVIARTHFPVRWGWD